MEKIQGVAVEEVQEEEEEQLLLQILYLLEL
jgi:hypothetical protein